MPLTCGVLFYFIFYILKFAQATNHGYGVDEKGAPANGYTRMALAACKTIRS